MTTVKNLPAIYQPFIVAFEVNGDLWYWGSWDEEERAHMVARELNGIVLYADEMEEQAMTNNQLCNLLGAVGCTLTATCMFLMLFGATGAVWGAAAGIIIGAISLFSYD